MSFRSSTGLALKQGEKWSHWREAVETEKGRGAVALRRKQKYSAEVSAKKEKLSVLQIVTAPSERWMRPLLLTFRKKYLSPQH